MSGLRITGALTAPDVFLRFENADPIKAGPELVAAARSFGAATTGRDHEFVDI